MKNLFASMIVLLTGLIASPAYSQQPVLSFDKVVAFGDSLTDNGNLYAFTGGQLLPFPYAGGRASNGPVWVEYLGLALNSPLKDKAYVGGQTGFGLKEAPPSIADPLGLTQGDLRIPSVGMQISNYLLSDQPTDDSLVVIWAGSNDIFFGQANNQVIVNNIGIHMNKLASKGAKTFLVLNMPPLHKTPYANNPDNADEQLLLQYATLDFNFRLEAKLDELDNQLDATIVRYDVDALLDHVISNPQLYGFTNVTNSFLEDYLIDPNVNPLEYLFWDDIHPTSSGHFILASAALNTLEASLVAEE